MLLKKLSLKRIEKDVDEMKMWMLRYEDNKFEEHFTTMLGRLEGYKNTPEIYNKKLENLKKERRDVLERITSFVILKRYFEEAYEENMFENIFGAFGDDGEVFDTQN